MVTTPDGHSTLSVSTWSASPKPKFAGSSFWLAYPFPPAISRVCQSEVPSIVARSEILAPVAERLEACPTNLTSNQFAPLPRFR